MRRNEPLPVHPAAGDPTKLGEYIAMMPGGGRNADWQDGEEVVVAVWMTAQHPRLPLPYVFEAYPPRKAFGGSASGGYLFQVPKLVSEMLTWYQEEHEWEAEVLSAPVEGRERWLGLYARLWAACPEDTVGFVNELLDLTEQAALEHDLDVFDLQEVVATLWTDGGADPLEYEKSIEHAVMVLSK